MLKALFLLTPSILWAGSFDAPKQWNGLYAGGNVGGIFNRASLNANHIALSNWSGTCNSTNHFNSAFIGPQAGFIHQYESNMVLGIEGDFTYHFSQSTDTNCVCNTYPDIYDQFTLSNRNQGSIKGRLGYAMNHNLLPYFTAGGSFANLGISYSNETVQSSNTNNQIQSGIVLGGGLEWAYSKKLSFRIEYDYYQYTQLTVKIPYIYDLYDTVGQGSFNLSANSIRGAINYWF